MFQTNSIMAHYNNNYLYIKKEGLVSVAWDNNVSAHGESTYQKTGNP